MSRAPGAMNRLELDEALAQCPVDPASDLPVEVQQAVQLARLLQTRATLLQTPHERKQQHELDRLIQDPHDKATLVQMTDQAFRSRAPQRAVDQLVHILDVQGIPRFFNPFDRTLLRGFQSFGSYLPGVAVPLVREKMRQETANVILPAEHELLVRHLLARWQEGIRMNVNFLGEALLGEEQARRRLAHYLEALQAPEIEVISVKISTIYSQISTLAREHTLETLCERLELLFRAAAKAQFIRPDGSYCAKWVYLDMEEYRDMSLTAEAFMRTLDRPGLEQARAGLALQAYIPDSYVIQKQLNEWARKRVAAGGAPITLRLVKGANLEMERVEASLQGWPQAPFREKIDTDANFQRMLDEAMQPDNLRAVQVGVASHNLFDLAYGVVLASRREAQDAVQLEMLEGMANHQRRALFEVSHNLLLYAPACRREDFIYAIGYLIRRLDENTGPDNFLRHAFQLRVGSEEWQRLESSFLQAFTRIPHLPESPRRTQDRRQPPAGVPVSASWQTLINEPNTDFALPQNTEWAAQLVHDWERRCDAAAPQIPLVIGGEARHSSRRAAACHDPSRPGVVVGRYSEADEQDVDQALRCAAADPSGWRAMSYADRSAILAAVAQQLRLARADLIGAALADGGKIIAESDPEVSEAVDFVEFYRLTAEYFAGLPSLRARGKGTVVVVSPWNFPIAIPCGGIAAGLAAGNTVILKPASDAVLPAYLVCDCFWRAGVPRAALQFVPCAGGGAGQRLVSHPNVAAVILTGGTATAEAILRAKPDCPLFAETGGKNATIVTALSDRDQVIKNVLHSAFSHSGQKCSATSLLLLEEEVYEDGAFREALVDAVESLAVGSAWDLRTRIGPLIRPPRGDLEKGLKELEAGESWLTMPELRHRNPHLFSPGIKWGVQPGSYTHRTEFFGPVLGVLKFRKLTEAIDWVNATGYGLTSGLESLDDREQELWSHGIRAGNLYINRPTTGAIVLRQPFGGLGKSAFGSGIKAGGPNYVAQWMQFEDVASVADGPRGRLEAVRDPRLKELRDWLETPESRACLGAEPAARLLAAIASYDRNAREEFQPRHDHFRLLGQDNFRLYRPVRELRIRVHPDDSAWEILARVCAARAAGCRTTVSFPSELRDGFIPTLDALTSDWAGHIEFVEESDAELAQVITNHQTARVRYAAATRVPAVVRAAAAQANVFLADSPIHAEGRVELLWYVEEQSLSANYHRYGNLGDRAGEARHDPGAT